VSVAAWVSMGEPKQEQVGPVSTPQLQLLLSQLKLDNGARIAKEPNSNPARAVARNPFFSLTIY